MQTFDRRAAGLAQVDMLLRLHEPEFTPQRGRDAVFGGGGEVVEDMKRALARGLGHHAGLLQQVDVDPRADDRAALRNHQFNAKFIVFDT